MAVIEKKSWPDKFDEDQKVSCDFRLADFDLQAGDTVKFKEWDPKTKKYSGREYEKKVKRVTKHESPLRYWTPEQINQYGMYLIEWED